MAGIQISISKGGGAEAEVHQPHVQIPPLMMFLLIS